MINVDGYPHRRSLTTTYSCDRADRDRGIEAWTRSTFGAFAILAYTFATLTQPSAPIFVMTLAIGVSFLLSGIGRFVLRSQVPEAPSRWRQGNDAVEFGPSWGFLLWEQLPPLVATIGALLAQRMPLSPGISQSEASRTMFLTWALLAVTALMWAFMPANPPRTPELILGPSGIWLWPNGRHHTYIPWELDPVVEGILDRSLPRAVITTAQGGPSFFSMFPIPLGYVQLQRVVEFYSTHPELRDELATETGLNRVRTLMYTPIWQVEKSLSSTSSAPTAPGRQDQNRNQGTTSPR